MVVVVVVVVVVFIPVSNLDLSPFPRCRQLSQGALTFPRLHPLRPLAHSPADRALPTTHASTALSGPCATSPQFYKNSIQYPRIAGDQKTSTSTSTSCRNAAGGGRHDKHPIAGDPRDDFMAGDSKGLSVIEDGQWGRWKVEAGVGAEEGKRHKRALLVPSTGIDAGSEVGGRVPRANAEGAVVVDVDAGEGGADDDFWRVVHVLWLERHLHGGRSPLGKGAAGVTHRNGRLEPGGSDSGECRRHGEAVDGNRHEERNGRQGRSLREHFSSAAEQSRGRVNPKLPAIPPGPQEFKRPSWIMQMTLLYYQWSEFGSTKLGAWTRFSRGKKTQDIVENFLK